MSCSQWERGEITVPSAEMAGLHKKLRDWTNNHHDLVRAQTALLHKEIGQGTRSVKLYNDRLNAFERKMWDHEAQVQRNGSWGYRKPAESAVAERRAKGAALEVLRHMLYVAGRDDAKGIHQPTVAEIANHAPKVTNRTASFACIGDDGTSDANISFKGNVVTWDVQEGNRSRERAHETALAGIFFAALNQIKWTRTSGGFATGNDEHNQEDTGAGGGANYITFSYGPAGERVETEESARRMGMTVAAYKKMKAKAPAPRATAYARRW
jgi:hypothetical protein